MGRAQIISEAGEGLYTIEVKHNTTAADTQLAKFNAIITSVESDIDAAEAEIDLAKTDISNAESALEDAEAALDVAETNKTVAEEAMNSDPIYQAAVQDVHVMMRKTSYRRQKRKIRWTKRGLLKLKRRSQKRRKRLKIQPPRLPLMRQVMRSIAPLKRKMTLMRIF